MKVGAWDEDRLVELVVETMTTNGWAETIRPFIGSLEDSVRDIYQAIYRDQEEIAQAQYVEKKDFIRTKQRWVRTANTNLLEQKGPLKELRSVERWAREHFDKYGPDLFEKMHGQSDVATYVQVIQEGIVDWADDMDRPLTSYLFIKEKTKKQQARAAEIDIAQTIGRCLIRGDARRRAHQSPNIAISHPFFGVSNRARLKVDKGQGRHEGEDGMFYPVLDPKDDLQGRQLIVSDDFIRGLNEKVPDLDSRDFELFLDVLNFRDQSFQTNRRIQFPLDEFDKRLYGTVTERSRQVTTERILKLGNYRITERNKTGYYVRSLFSTVRIEDVKTGDKTARIVSAFVSEDVYDELVKQEIISIYSDKVMELKGSFAYHLVFVLQKERRIAHQMQESNPVRRRWETFRYAIRFNRRRKSENLQELDEALEMIKSRQFIVEDFYRSGETYFLTFFPLNEFELADFGMGRLEH